MSTRFELHDQLVELLGSNYVYFQPPETAKLYYPCIIYSLSGLDEKRANNHHYGYINRYDIMVIDSDPDSEIPMKVLTHFPMCSFDRNFTADNLYHSSFRLYY